jgi:ATP-dependent Zn protease
MVLSKLKKRIQSFFQFLLKICTNKKTWLIFAGLLLFYKIKTFPEEVPASSFLRLLESSKSQIKKLANLDNNLMLFNTSLTDSKTYLVNYNIGNIDSFNKSLMLKDIQFNFYNGFQAFLLNPFNQLYTIAFTFSFLGANIVSDYILKNKKKNLKKNTSLINPTDVYKHFIANQDIKKKINILIDQIKNPDKYKSKGVKLLKGVLLYGRPGTGKTLLARILSKLHGISFINTCASEFVEIYVGSGPKKMREVFDLARERRPSIIFIDELESIGSQRSSDFQSYTHNIERYSTLNQLLSEMDGLNEMDGVMVIAATNREDLLDAALVRPGRFDFKINLAPPDKQLRKELIQLYLSKHQIEKIEDTLIDEIVNSTEGMTGANIEGIINDAATIAYSRGEKEYMVDDSDLLNSNNSKILSSDLADAAKKSIEEFHKFRQYEMRNSHY